RGLRLDAVELAELLHGAFDRVGDLLGDLLGARPGVRSHDQRLLDGELRVLEPAHLLVGDEPADDGQRRRDEYHPVVLDGRDAKVHGRPPPSASPRSRTFIPSRRCVTPATAMRSPGCSPSAISILLPVACPSLTDRRVTVSSGVTTHTTCSPDGSLNTAETGTRIRSPRIRARR